jgi:hypothetical protein
METNKLTTNDFIDELRQIFVEGEFAHRWALIETYHKAGELIVSQGIDNLQDVAQSIGRSERTLYYAVKFYEKFPDINIFPEGKNISWNKIVTTYLPDTKRDIEHEHQPITICSSCKKRI